MVQGVYTLSSYDYSRCLTVDKYFVIVLDSSFVKQQEETNQTMCVLYIT